MSYCYDIAHNVAERAVKVFLRKRSVFVETDKSDVMLFTNTFLDILLLLYHAGCSVYNVQSGQGLQYLLDADVYERHTY